MNMDTYMFGNWQPIVPIKLSQNQGALLFLQSDRHVKIAIDMGGQTTTQINFFIKIKVKKVCRENSNCKCF